MFKNYVSYWGYLFKYQWKEWGLLLIDTSIFIMSSYSLINEYNMTIQQESSIRNLVIITSLSAIKFLYDFYSICKSYRENIDVKSGKIFEENIKFDKFKVDNTDLKQGYEIVECKINNQRSEYIMHSKEIDKYIMSNTLKINIDKEKKKKISKFLKINSSILLPFIKRQYKDAKNRSKSFYNEKKLCLSSDIEINNKNSVYCHSGEYYDTFLTNIVSGRQLRSNNDNTIISSAEAFFPMERNNKDELYLKSISRSIMNNEIGVSTLGITADNHLVIWRQNRSAQSSNDLLVPTGSGSSDWTDKKSDIFNEAIINGMNRELWEESTLANIGDNYRKIGNTKIIGFFRWINKGGKPEFVGITKMNKLYSAIDANNKEVYIAYEYKISDIDDINRAIDEILTNENISVPLYMNLICLRNYYNSNRDELHKFLFKQNN